jgi:uncharacterized protein YyaL (SSP411 family)
MERTMRPHGASLQHGGFMTPDNIDWQRDVDAALAEAKRSNKPLLLDFTAAPA